MLQRRELLTESDLSRFLWSNDVSTSEWGTGATKTLGHLVDELNAGESTIHVDDSQRVCRHVRAVDIDVLSTRVDGAVEYLYEARQVFADGTERVRDRDSSIAEKFAADEVADTAAWRGIKEEIGLGRRDVRGLYRTKKSLKIEQSSESYPGVKSLYLLVGYAAMLTPSAYRPEGYEEVTEEKTTYFEWRDL